MTLTECSCIGSGLGPESKAGRTRVFHTHNPVHPILLSAISAIEKWDREKRNGGNPDYPIINTFAGKARVTGVSCNVNGTGNVWLKFVKGTQLK